ncbi:phosphoribosylanthranilate isomerase [Gloeobacter violaceus]|uniref:N-(5'-phosphoribosyl)anthranilate isomerase n=1 Tax=Gloeobacter violaceus (strain ATCC 29082 / PCC 7421) TaxID=251221 RepID=TRPF_GLOVI|nr:phosphoribosylanthranilate isomerase [Gloeobacter violaceus]Q7NML1.1 RecName: Full=N-(5'-phosphoribosyl)anthranilate isomerase; Short=PRAI [Gloeobacter violaceus PCC 7421]BAC88695.1 N-(5'-phosphoribosyl)anthranilate isomerase [Gloeobacter violaceus PCC 7421]
MRVKICGFTDPGQAQAAARLGVHALGFVCVPGTPRYVDAARLREIAAALPPFTFKVGVFVDAPVEAMRAAVEAGELQGVQLHGEESPETCAHLARTLPGILRIKALRVREPADLEKIALYVDAIEAVLLDAWHPTQAGGTGRTLDWKALQGFCPALPWMLSGGLRADNLAQALDILTPDAVDLSSGVENGVPGQKDLSKITQILHIAQGNTGQRRPPLCDGT